jgi:hypothetical protein
MPNFAEARRKRVPGGLRIEPELVQSGNRSTLLGSLWGSCISTHWGWCQTVFQGAGTQATGTRVSLEG